MATFDQLAADQRAIIEIVLRQDRSYEQIGEMLDLPPTRVRELAREALSELAPFTAEFVDPDWRGQLADYVLGQQTGPEAQATRGHLRRSEPARIWAYSLLDALDDFYEDGERPEIPVGESGGKPRRDRSAAPAAAAAATANGEGGTAAAAARPAGGGLSPAAKSALMRRRIISGVVALLVLALLIFGGIELFGGSSSKKSASANTGTTPSSTSGANSSQSGQSGQVVAEAALSPIGKSFKGTGAAIVYQSGNQSLAVVRAKVPPSTGGNKYVLWLYNNDRQLRPIAADGTDKNGNFQGAAALPSNWASYKFIDLTYQNTSGKNVRHGTSVMRGPLMAPQQTGNGSTTGTNTGTGTTTTP
jgi:hypothetical protein